MPNCTRAKSRLPSLSAIERRPLWALRPPPGKMQVADYVLRELKGGFLDEFNITAECAADLVERILTEGAK